MQIQTTKRPNGIQGAAQAKEAPPQQEQEQEAQAPKDSFGSTVKQSALGEARHLGNRFANVAGGAGGVIGASLGATAALTGGAIVGMAAGGAAAVPIGTFFSSGGFDAIKTGLSAVGTGGQIGIGLGLVTLAAGGWVVGDKLAGLVAKPVGYGLGLGTGTVKGTLRHFGQEAGALPPLPREEKAPKKPIVSEKGKFMATTQRVFGGTGVLIGATGGATMGLATAAGIEAVGGIFNGFDIGAVTRAGLIGAGIGAAAGGIVGGIGGWKVADMIHSGINGVAEANRISQKLLEQDKRGNLMDELRDRLDADQADLAKEKQAGDTNIENRTQSLNTRSQELTKQQQTLNDKLTNEDGLTQARSNELYTNKTNELGNYEGRLDADKAHLDSEKVRLTGKEGNIDNLIREEATSRKVAHEAAEQSKYDTRKGQLETREDGLQKRESNINEIANDKVQKELQPLRDEASRARSDAASNRSQASNYRSDASRLEGQVGGILAEAQMYDSRANSQESENHGLRSQESSLSSQESRLSSDLSECERQKRHRDNSNTGGGGGGHRDDSNTGGSHRGGSRTGGTIGGGTIGGGSHRSGSRTGGVSSGGHRSSSRTGASSGGHRSSSRTGR